MKFFGYQLSDSLHDNFFIPISKFWLWVYKIFLNIDDSRSSQKGFTLVEMLVSVAIVMMISGQVLVSFSSLNEASTLTRAASELAFNIRRAQNMSLSITGVRIGGIMQIPRSVGLKISSEYGANDKYFFFADQDSNGIYTDASERIEPNIVLPGNVRITAITREIVTNKGAHIIFYTPEATLALTDANRATIPNFMNITLKGPSGGIRVVRIRMSGQVTVF